jgi:hypothetical protein
MTRTFLGSSAGLLLLSVAATAGRAQSADTPSQPAVTASVADTAAFDAERDSSCIAAAETLGLSEAQRQLFYKNVQAVVGDALAAHPDVGRSVIDSAVFVVTRETGRKMRFLRQARLLFSEMFARRSGDDDRAPGSEEELWRSSRNVAGLIDLYRKNPEASDAE